MSQDAAKWTVLARVDKFSPEQVVKTQIAAPQLEDFIRLGISPEEVREEPGNILTTAGITRLWTNFISVPTAANVFSQTYARLGVGNSATAAAAAQTDLQAASGTANRWFQAMDAGYPQVSGAVLTARATYGGSDALFAWNEWAIDNGGGGTSASGTTVGPTMLNRRVPSPALGTKASGAVWVLTVTITIA